MRKTIAAFGAAIALITASACGPTGPNPKPSISPSTASAAPSPTVTSISRDTYRDEFDKAIAVAKSTLGLKVTITTKDVAADKQVDCDNDTVDGTVTVLVAYCEKQRYIPVTEAMLNRLVAEQAPPATVWYLVGRALAPTVTRKGTPVYGLADQYLCAAGFVAAKRPGFTVPDRSKLQSYVLKYPDIGVPATKQAANMMSGVMFAQQGGSVSACAA